MKILFVSMAIALFSAAPTHAQRLESPNSIHVPVADLDLGTTKGQKMLDLRILHAASSLCGTPSPADPNGKRRYAQCRSDARAEAASARDHAIALAPLSGRRWPVDGPLDQLRSK